MRDHRITFDPGFRELAAPVADRGTSVILIRLYGARELPRQQCIGKKPNELQEGLLPRREESPPGARDYSATRADSGTSRAGDRCASPPGWQVTQDQGKVTREAPLHHAVDEGVVVEIRSGRP